MEKSGVFEGAIVSLSSSGLVQPSISLESENPGDDILDDLDSYLEDINDRLTISRMVSDSVIKGMVDAISEEAAEKIGMKELEIASLKERLRIYETEAKQTAEVRKSNFSDAKLWERKSQSRGSQTVNQDTNINELSSLRQDLDAILTLLTSSETGQLFPHASHEGSEERNSTKKKDHFHRKVLSSHTSPTDSFTERNGKHDKSESTEPDNMESVQLKHMSKEELINYYKGEMTKMKRNHESQVHDITEKYFSLRRDILKENGPSLLRKDKNFEALRTKIPEVITKLDDILMENEKLHVANDNIENLSCLKDKLDTLFSENLQLKDSLSSSRKEIKCLLSQVSDASNNMSNHSMAEANLLNQITKLKSEIEDMKIEFSVKEEVYECFLKDFLGKSKWDIEDSEMESISMHEICEIVFREAAIDAKATTTSGIEDSNMEYLITEELIGIIFKEVFKDAKTMIEHLTLRYEIEKERRASLHASLLESEKVLSLELEEKSKLKEEILSFAAMLEEKEKLAREAHCTLMKEKEHSDLIYQETNRLEQQVSQQESLITEIRMESSLMKSNFEEALNQIHLYEEQMKELVQNLELAREDLENTNMQKNTLLNNIVEKQSIISSVEAKEIEQRRQLSSIIMTVQILSKAVLDFECRAMEKFKMNNLRLERLNTLCNALGRKANLLRKAELVYKQKLDRRSSDLQKAEAEVDLLGDEVDVLLSLLEKIYVALDHYSPILQHYPGIMEILKLVRRELSGETTKTV